VQRYGSREVLYIPDLTFSAGKITAVVGPSGAGKSTLLRLLNFLERPTAGAIVWDGATVSFPPPVWLLRRVTTVFQRPILLNRSINGNLAYGLQLRRQPIQPQVLESWLQRIGLAGRGREMARRLSAGEMQRVALARALLLQPDVLLLDEPTANLDPANVAIIEKLIRADQQQRQTTVIMVTHNLYQAQRMGDMLLVLMEGEMIEMGRCADLFKRPTRPETAAFLQGQMVF
jgi:tungstate transport system ATP-binding protein